MTKLTPPDPLSFRTPDARAPARAPRVRNDRGWYSPFTSHPLRRGKFDYQRAWLKRPDRVAVCYNVSPAFAVGEWLSLVEHLVRDQGVGGSNPLSPTNFLLLNQILASNIKAKEPLSLTFLLGFPTIRSARSSVRLSIEAGELLRSPAGIRTFREHPPASPQNHCGNSRAMVARFVIQSQGFAEGCHARPE